MKLVTQLSCGDKAWIYYGRYTDAVQEATVGQIRIEHILKTKEECEAAFAEHIAEQVEKKRSAAEYERRRKLGNENILRMQLAEIEQLKLEKQ